ncbi:MAG: class I SAM-dependent methyltransferase [Endomicrobiales bacterium]|nr:class I SAM-dependent methyltransferase [Endomicrobiales bacterium]
MKRNCPICGGDEKELLYRQNFGSKAIALMEGYDVAACDRCGFVFADNIPSQEEFNKYYEEMSKYEFNYSDGVVSKEYVAHFQKIVDFIRPFLKDKNANILDMGCSTGCLLSLFKKEGYGNLLGVDPSPSCAKTVKEVYGIEAVADNIANFDKGERYDLIVLSAVLEHLVDFSEAMLKIKSLLKENGLLFIEVPDASRFNSYIYTAFQQFSIEHINYFSEYSVKNLLSSYSLETVKVQESENRINQTVDPDLFIVSRRKETVGSKMAKDEITKKSLEDYIEKCGKIDIAVKKTISERIGKKDRIIIWGVGTHTQMLVGSGLDLSKVLYFVDSNARYKGKKINGIEVKLPADIRENVPILISTYSYQEEVIRQIKEKLGLKNEIIRIYDK